jgi:zinc transporter ZupT
MEYFMATNFFITILSLSFLPLFSALCAGWGKVRIFEIHHKKIVFVFSLVILGLIFHDVLHHQHEEGEFLFMALTSLCTFIVLSMLHVHHKKNEAVGIVSAEFFHSLVDGVILGIAYLTTPLLFYATALGIIAHEMPKVVATGIILRALIQNKKSLPVYGLMCQMGIPFGFALSFVMLQTVSSEIFHSIEAASNGALVALVLLILWRTFRHHHHH